MTVTGIVWFGRDFDWFGSATADHASELSQNVFLALLVHQIVVFPYGVTPLSASSACSSPLRMRSRSSATRRARLSDTANTIFSALAIALVPVDRLPRRRPLAQGGRRTNGGR